MSNLPLLRVDDVTIVRGDERLVEGLTWSHGPGSIAWINGPNGAGKSSLMRVLARIDAPHAGAVQHTREEAARNERNDVAFYSPAMALPPEPKAVAFSDLVRRILGGPVPLGPDRALARKQCRSLSTGEEKRLLLGPILARGRPFVFLDEPYEHLSREARVQLTDAMVELARRAIVVVATNQPIPHEAEGPTITLSLTEAPHVA